MFLSLTKVFLITPILAFPPVKMEGISGLIRIICFFGQKMVIEGVGSSFCLDRGEGQDWGDPITQTQVEEWQVEELLGKV